MVTKAERELLGIIDKNKARIKKLKLECGQQATQICVRNLRITELEDVCRNALTSLAIINLPLMTPDVATDKELMDIMAESFKQVLKGVAVNAAAEEA